MCSPKVLSEVYESIGREGRKISRRSMFAALGTGALGATVMAGAVQPTASATPSGRTIVDLTHVLTPEFPVWPGARSFEMRNLAKIADAAGSLGSLGSAESGGNFYLNELRLEEHTGTHIDAPAHASADGITVEKIPVADLVVPIAVVDISARASVDPDTLLTRQDILDWESLHGTIAPRSLVAMNSGWDTRAGAGGAFTNRDALGVQHTPGFNPEAIDFLVRERDIVAVGSDTLSIDAGRSTTHGAHRSALGSGKYAVEALANLSALPAVGATVMVGAPTHAGGSGGPCRVIAWY
ncbi:cyclase family protein [Rhodococcus qingshengii]|uniref:cyclase family protein n=1 Tax=Rhodococcus qingshengii TaxID=334542 RepID=UPI001BE66638|nr:cyclase family protein [Rhodococcus qingshengii]MBT2271298.1 cyclase family protein [Rhodococcus qingshengii]